MPCDSSYMEPTQLEKELRHTAELLIYVATLKYTGLTQEELLRASETALDPYAHNDFVPTLCDLIKTMTPAEQERIVYNAHDRRARDLADWWEKHQEADRKREAKEQAAKRRADLIKQARVKLTQEEWDALHS